MKSFTVQELLEVSKKRPCTIIDIRETFERDLGAIENSLHIPMGEIESRLEEIPSTNEVIFYCQTGKRASAVVDFLEREKHFTNLYNLDGGIEAWNQAHS